MDTAESQNAQQPGVLIVDDTGSNLVVLSAVLNPLRVRLVEASNGHDALQRVSEESFAVALLDVQMPEMDGFEVARRIRQLKNGRELPIIFVTAIHRDQSFARRGYAVGAADYVTKPFDVEVLRARVRAFVDLYQQREEVRRAQVALRTRERDEALRRVVAFERVATAALETNDLKALLEELLGIFLDGADKLDFARVLLRAGDELQLAASVTRGAALPAEHASIRREDTFPGFVALTRRAQELRADGGAAHAEWMRESGAQALLGFPLLNDGELLGVAYAGSRQAGELSARERTLFRAVAERVAWAIAKHTERARLHSLLTAAPMMIATFRGREHCADFVNPLCEKFLEQESWQGKTATEIGWPRAITGLLDGALVSGEEIRRDEFPLERPRGEVTERRYLNLTVRPVRSAVGWIDGVTLFAVDVTAQVTARQLVERHQAERSALLERERAARADAEAANRAKDEFLATLSHELRTPLNAVLGWSLRARTKTGPDLERALNIIARNAQAQARIVDDMLDLSRIINGKLSLELKPVWVHDPVRGAIEALRPSADAKEVRLETDIDAEFEVKADADRLQQVVWNLLSNAIKFTPQGGKVEVLVRRQGELVEIAVHDTGQGIAPEFLPNVFTRFRQADGSATRHHGGLGLGLAIAKQLAEAHGGDLRASSEGVGHGAVFSLRLPLRSVGAFPAEGTSKHWKLLRPGADEGVRLDHVRVLVVDDETDARILVSEVLSDTGAVVRTAESAADALAQIQEFLPHVIVSDIAMPGADGYHLIRQLRALPAARGGSIKAVALTAFARSEDVQRALAEGFERHMSKPLDVDKLKAVVAALADEAMAVTG
jgi:signal transduction histidine kinase/response regulator RpfG family c-di-GMP phosphodiesterase